MGAHVSRPDTPGERVHSAFVSLGMRHLVAVDSRSHVRGVITRKDLDAAAGHGGWRRNKMAPAPKPPPPEGAGSNPGPPVEFD
jgi:chloride channel 7